MDNKNGSLEEALTQERLRLPPLSTTCSIYRVPERLRHVNERAYKPKVVSIGPYHHGREDLQATEEHKMRYLDELIDKSHKRLGSYIEVVLKKEAELRDCYAEANRFNRDEFARIILLDAIFIIVFLLKLKFQDMRIETDRIFGKPWMIQDIWFDMILLENQLPFFILEDIYNHHGMEIRDKEDEHLVDILELSCYFFQELMHLGITKPKSDIIHPPKIEHFVDLLRRLYLPSNSQTGKLQTITTPSITELHQAGVKFEVGSSGNLFDLRLVNGRLQIPKLNIGVETEISIRNLLAFEQCHYKDNHVNDYVVIMNRLVNTKKDVDLVVKYKIVENRLSNNKDGSFLINNLTDGVVLDFENFYFANLCEDLNKYCSNPWHMWMATLRQKYFNTPWAVISFIAAGIALVLTFIQTVCSVISAKYSHPNGAQP